MFSGATIERQGASTSVPDAPPASAGDHRARRRAQTASAKPWGVKTVSPRIRSRHRNTYADRTERMRRAGGGQGPSRLPAPIVSGYFDCDPGEVEGDADGGSLTRPNATVTVSPGLMVCTAAGR